MEKRKKKSPEDLDDGELESEMDAALGDFEEDLGPSTSLIWMDSASPLNQVYDVILHGLCEKVFWTSRIFALAEAVSNVLPRDVYEYPEWLEVDRKYGKLDLDRLSISQEHWFARLRAIRAIQRQHAIVGMQAGKPQQELISIKERFNVL